MTTNDSKAQQQQKQQNAQRQQSSGKDGNFDKRLDGPNRPST